MTECYEPTLQQKIGCNLGAHDFKEYAYMKGKYFCLRLGCKTFRGLEFHIGYEKHYYDD